MNYLSNFESTPTTINPFFLENRKNFEEEINKFQFPNFETFSNDNEIILSKEKNLLKSETLIKPVICVNNCITSSESLKEINIMKKMQMIKHDEKIIF